MSRRTEWYERPSAAYSDARAARLVALAQAGKLTPAAAREIVEKVFAAGVRAGVRAEAE